MFGCDLAQCAGAALEVDAGVDPGGGGDDAAELEEGGAVGPFELAEHGGGHAEAGGGELVGVAGERVDQLDEERHLAEREVGEHLGADVEVLGGERAGLPSALVEGAALLGPIGGLGDVEVGGDGGAGAEERAGEGGGGFHQADADGAPLAHLVVDDLLEQAAAAAEVFGGGLPRAERVLGDGDAGADPVFEFVGFEHGLDAGEGGLEVLGERGREGLEALAGVFQRRGDGSVGHSFARSSAPSGPAGAMRRDRWFRSWPSPQRCPAQHR